MEAALAPSLDLYAQSVPETDTPKCPNPGRGILQHKETGALRPVPCGIVRCEVCGPFEAWVRARCIASVEPDRFLVLTFPECKWEMGWQPLRQHVRKFNLWVRDELDPAHRAAFTVEKGKSGNLHVNMLQRGPNKLPQRSLQARWGGIVHVSKIKSEGTVGRYALKEAMRVSGYAMKEAGGHLSDHLTLNGGRLAHWTRDYFDGRRIGEVRAELRGESEWEWKLESAQATQELRGRRLANALRNR